jgi:L-ascorbate metabolism protein UlaG (beta-lactamase superfamily)
VTDPAGIAKTEADIVTISQHDPAHADLSRLKNQPFVIDAPGEYEINGVSVFGFAVNVSNIYLIEIEGVRVAYLADLTHLDEKTLEDLDGVDVLLVKPQKEVIELINKIEPSIVVPMAEDETKLEEFLKEYGSEGERMEKLVVSKGGLGEETRIVILEK